MDPAVTLFLPLGLGIFVVLLAAGITTGSRARRTLGALVAVSQTLAPLLVPPEHTTVRALWAIVATMGVVRTLDLVRGEWTLGDRIVHVLSVIDTRRLSRTAPLRPGALLPLVRVLAWESVALLSYLAWLRVGPSSAPLFWLTRWSLGLVFVYTFSEGAYVLLWVGYRVAGFVTPPLHITPAAARSVQEFWGARWNRVVSTWLGETFFRPLARRRRPLVGAALAFGASALLHGYIAWVAVGGTMGVVAFLYFMAQSVLMLVELPLRVRQWRPVLGHAWTIGWMVLLSPGFTEPMARTLGL